MTPTLADRVAAEAAAEVAPSVWMVMFKLGLLVADIASGSYSSRSALQCTRVLLQHPAIASWRYMAIILSLMVTPGAGQRIAGAQAWR